MRRLMLYDRLGNPLGELAEADVFEAILREEINGEHSLTITTTKVLEKGIRLLYQDGRSKWREFVVAGVDAEHASGNRAIGTYYCVWSVQQDLQGVTVSVMPGTQSPVTASFALQSLLSTTDRWIRGTVTQATSGGASMYDRSAWEALSTLVEVWGGEVDAAITVDSNGVTGRAVNLYNAQGNQTASRRFDFAHDLQSVKRTLADEPLFCRISPRGKGEQTDAGGYGRKITIESVNDGKDYLVYNPMVDVAKLPDGNGGWEYPTLIVENSNCETPESLKTWAEGAIADYCTPKITYEVDVIQAGIEGVDVTGVSLGDAVQVVDRKFSDDGIRIEGRVHSVTTDLLNERDISIVIGDVKESIASKFASMNKALSVVDNDITVMSTAQYLQDLIERLNAEINATGGYTYIVPGNGILTFDVEVEDPLNPVEANQVVEIKGGSIRIANSKTAQGEWEWKSVFVSGHIAADLVTAAQLTAGYIGSAGGTNYWNLDTGEFRLSNQATVDGDPIMTGFSITYAQNQSDSQSPDPYDDTLWSDEAPEWREGYYIWQRLKTKSAGQTDVSVTCISGRDGATGTHAIAIMLYARAPEWTIDGTELIAGAASVFSVTGTTAKISGTINSETLVLHAVPGLDMAETLTYTFETGELTGNLGSWSRSIPAGTTALYVTMANAISNDPSDDINRSEWSEPVALSAAGIDGLNSATVYLYRRSKTWVAHGTELRAPNASDMSVSGTIATIKGTVSGTTFTFASAAPANPSTISGYTGSTYTFATAELSNVPTGWYTEIPDGKDAIWVTAACAVSSSATDGIDKDEWSDVVLMSEPGIGVDNAQEQYYLSTSKTTLSGGSWSSSQPTLVKGKYLWVREKITWSDGVITYTDPQLAEAINTAFYEAKTAAEEVVTLDESLNMDGMMARLTNNFQWQGIYQDPQTGEYYINAEMLMSRYVNASIIEAGILSDAHGYNYWNLATGELSMNATRAKIGNSTVSSYVNNAASNAASSLDNELDQSEILYRLTGGYTTEGLYISNGHLYMNASYIKTGYIGSVSSGNYWNLNNNQLSIGTSTAIGSTTAGTLVSDTATAKSNASQALTNAANAAKTATNYLTFNSTNGLDIGYSGTNSKTRINGSGVEIFDNAGNSAITATSSGGTQTVRVGRSNAGNVTITNTGIDINYASTNRAHFGGSTPYYTFGSRKSGSTNGQNSFVLGSSCVASAQNSFAIGRECEATGLYAVAEGMYCKARGQNSHAGGVSSETSSTAHYSFAFGHGVLSNYVSQTSVGAYNISNAGSMFTVGNGSSSRSNALEAKNNGNLWIAGTLTQNSDRRLKTHNEYLGEDAVEFVRALKPALFTKDGERRIGFYAQDVQEAEPEGWNTATVTSSHTDESLDFDPLTLEYSALIAPIVTYCQHLEKRIEELEKIVTELENRSS